MWIRVGASLLRRYIYTLFSFRLSRLLFLFLIVQESVVLVCLGSANAVVLFWLVVICYLVLVCVNFLSCSCLSSCCSFRYYCSSYSGCCCGC
jgi:hypothetical protein